MHNKTNHLDNVSFKLSKADPNILMQIHKVEIIAVSNNETISNPLPCTLTFKHT